MQIGNIIKENRLKKELTQEELAEELFVSRQLVSRWENEKSYPDIIVLLKISDFFDLSLDELLRGDDQMLKKITHDAETGKVLKRYNNLYKIIVIVLICISVYLGFKVFNIQTIQSSDQIKQVTITDKGFLEVELAIPFYRTSRSFMMGVGGEDESTLEIKTIETCFFLPIIDHIRYGSKAHTNQLKIHINQKIYADIQTIKILDDSGTVISSTPRN